MHFLNSSPWPFTIGCDIYPSQDSLGIFPAERSNSTSWSGVSRSALWHVSSRSWLITGMIEFVTVCIEVDIQSIIGLEIDLESDPLNILAPSLWDWGRKTLRIINRWACLSSLVVFDWCLVQRQVSNLRLRVIGSIPDFAQIKRKQALESACFSSGGRIWTYDLWVMSVYPA